MYLATVDWATAMPSLSSSPWIRGAPQPGEDRELLAQGEVLQNQVGALAEHGADRGREGGQQGGHTNVGRRTDRWQQGLQHRRRDRPTLRGCSRCESAGDARTDFSVGTASCQNEAYPTSPSPFMIASRCSRPYFAGSSLILSPPFATGMTQSGVTTSAELRSVA